MDKTHRSSILDLFNSITYNPLDTQKTHDSKKPPKITSLSSIKAKSKRFPGEFNHAFEEKSDDLNKQEIQEALDVRKNFEGLEKWTSNLEHRRIMKNAMIRTKSSDISPLDERKLLQPDDLDPKLGMKLIDSILKSDQKPPPITIFQTETEIRKMNKNQRVAKSLEVKKHENNKKLLNDVIFNRLLLDRRQNKVHSWSIPDFEIRERTVFHESISNFKTLSMLMNKASTEHILNKEYLKEKIRNQIKKQETNKGVIIDKEELKKLKDLKEEFLDDLRKNQQEFEEYQSEIAKRNKIQDVRLYFDQMENAVEKANKKNIRPTMERRSPNVVHSVNNFMAINKIKTDRTNQMEAIEKTIKIQQSQLSHNLSTIDIVEKELQELKLQKDQLRIRQKEIYLNIFNIPNFQYFFPTSLTWIFKNLIKISEDFPEDIFPRFLNESDLYYLREVSELELEIEAKTNENRKNLKTCKKGEESSINFVNSKAKIDEVQAKLKEYKRKSLVVKTLDSDKLELKKIADFAPDFNNSDHENNSEALSQDNRNNTYANSGLIRETTSKDVRKLMLERSQSRRKLKSKVTFLENERGSQIKLEHFFEEKHEKIQNLKKQKKNSFLQEYIPSNVDEKMLFKLRQRTCALFGVKEAEQFLEENFQQNANFKKNNLVLNQNMQGHNNTREEKMKKVQKIKMEEGSSNVNYRFNPIYNRFPELINENNPNSTFLTNQNKFI